MGTAAAVGAVGVEALRRRGRYRPDVKPLRAGTLLGAALFGAGLAVLGHCPGTCIAAAAEGETEAAAGVLGMFAGALAFVAAYPLLKPVLDAADQGKRTLPAAAGTTGAPWAAALGGVAAAAVGARRLAAATP